LIYLNNQTRGSGLDVRALVRVLERLLGEIGEDGTSVSLTFVRDAAMRELNREHRGKNAPTDVLSFPMHAPDAFDRSGPTRPLARTDAAAEARGGVPERMLGDIVVSVDTALRQAAEYDAPLEREVQRLLIHAVLHLAGHDHIEPAERAVMEAEERRLADVIGMPWPYLESSAR
jgi:probable rRNA maturation factor